MAVYDRWHKTYPKLDDPEPDPELNTNDKPCKCGTVKRPMYPTADHPRPAENGRPAYKGGMRWQVRYDDPEGNSKKKNFRVKEGKNHELHAEAFETWVKGQINNGTYIDPAAGLVTLAEYAAQWRQAQPIGNPNTARALDLRMKYIYDVPLPEGAWKSRRKGAGQSSPIGDKPMSFLASRPSAIQAWIKWLENLMLVSEYVNQVVGTLSTIFRAAVDDGVVTRNPVISDSVRRPPPSEKPKVIPWTLEHINLAIGWLAENSPRDETMVDLGAGAGLRQSEIFAFAEEDIVFLERYVHVRRAVKIVDSQLVFGAPKRGKVRTVPLSEPLEFRLAAQIGEFKPVSVTLPWEKPGGKLHTAKLLYVDGDLPWRREVFNRSIWGPVREAAGFPAVPRVNTMHWLRHTFASACLSNGLDIRTLAFILGHTDPAFTLKFYGHLMPGAADHARAALGAFFNPKIQNPTALRVPSSARVRA